MGKALVFVLLLIGLTAFFKKAAEWFQDNKNINIIPASLIEMVAVFIFLGTYGSEYTNEIIWMWVSVVVVIAITVFNLIKYGVKDGILVSLAELVFSISAAILIAFIVVASSKKSKVKKNRYKR